MASRLGSVMQLRDKKRKYKCCVCGSITVFRCRCRPDPCGRPVCIACVPKCCEVPRPAPRYTDAHAKKFLQLAKQIQDKQIRLFE